MNLTAHDLEVLARCQKLLHVDGHADPGLELIAKCAIDCYEFQLRETIRENAANELAGIDAGIPVSLSSSVQVGSVAVVNSGDDSMEKRAL